MELPKGPHEITGLGTCMLLMNYLTQTDLMKTVSKLRETMAMVTQLFQ